MPCLHRFHAELIPQQLGLQYLFLGTFNPIWDAGNNNNADFYYGRETNLFWCIMPHAFGEDCLIDKGVSEWKAFCNSEEHKIGFIDLIRCVNNADENNKDHIKALTVGFSDKELDQKKGGQFIFDLDFTTSQIKEVISLNSDSLKGVFFTRSSNDGIKRIWSQWEEIINYCHSINRDSQKDIHCSALLTPSSRGRGSGIRKKITYWKEEIAQCK